MKFTGKVFMILAVFFLIAGSVTADTLTLNDGQVINGNFVGKSDTEITFEVGGQQLKFPTSSVKNISMGPGTAAPAAPAAPAAQAAPPAPVAATVAAGTSLMIKLQSTLDTKKHGSGHQFSANLEGNLMAGSAIVAPAGAIVYGVVEGSKKSGRLAGQSELKLTLTKINVNGQLKPIVTNRIQATSEKAGQQTVKRTARAAAVGGLIDGKDGARTGAKVGVGASVLAGGSAVVIPAGTLLEFRLQAPFTP